jgi:Tol biopolymer transport system component
MVLLLGAAPCTFAQTIRQITDFRAERFGEYAIDGSGANVVVVTTADPFGSNPSHALQAVRWSGAGVGSPLTGFGGLLESISVSDDGQWIAFGSIADPLGENPDRRIELFLQSADGSVLRQLTDRPAPDNASLRTVAIAGSGNRIAFVEFDAIRIVEATGEGLSTVVGNAGAVQSLSITDDGTMLVFTSEGDPAGTNPNRVLNVFRVGHDGAGLQQLTFDSPAKNDATVSGDGQLVAYESDGQIHVLGALTGYVPVAIADGFLPSLTDDSQWVYFSGMDEDNLEIFRSPSTGDFAERLTRTSAPVRNDGPRVAGDGSRVAFVRSGDAGDPGAPRRLIVMNGNGSVVEQLGPAESDFDRSTPDITPDGTRIVYHGGWAGSYDLFRVEADGSDLVQITSGAEALRPSITADGETIVFGSSVDLTGDNPCGAPQMFRIGADQSGLAQLTPSGSCEAHEYGVVSRDGSTVVYQQTGGSLYRVPGGGGTPSLVVTDSNEFPKLPRLSADGSLVVYQRGDDLRAAFLASTDGSFLEQIAYDAVGTSAYPDISLDGQTITFVDCWYCFPPVFVTPLWLYHPSTGPPFHLTEVEQAFHPRISGDGRFIYYYVGSLHRYDVTTGVSEYAGGLIDPRVPLVSTTVAVDGVGRAVYASRYNPTGGNADLSLELWLIDFDATPTFDIEKAAPAEVRFTPDPRGQAYDVIRGDLANLQAGAGDSVDLGPVVCLADDLPTTAALDPATPGPGQGFFYMFRWADGWGTASSGAPREAAGGDCSP